MPRTKKPTLKKIKSFLPDSNLVAIVEFQGLLIIGTKKDVYALGNARKIRQLFPELIPPGQGEMPSPDPEPPDEP